MREAAELLAEYNVWCGFYSKGFDIPFLNTRLLRWSKMPIEKRPHIDLYYTLKHNTLTARRSQAHYLRFFGTIAQKLDMDPGAWNDVLANPKKHMPRMVERCESDVTGLEAGYERSKHLIRDISR